MPIVKRYSMMFVVDSSGLLDCKNSWSSIEDLDLDLDFNLVGILELKYNNSNNYKIQLLRSDTYLLP